MERQRRPFSFSPGCPRFCLHRHCSTFAESKHSHPLLVLQHISDEGERDACLT